jgi:hypothetical protein
LHIAICALGQGGESVLLSHGVAPQLTPHPPGGSAVVDGRLEKRLWHVGKFTPKSILGLEKNLQRQPSFTRDFTATTVVASVLSVP